MCSVAVELSLLSMTLATLLLFILAAWCLAANVGFPVMFPFSFGPFSNWLVWICVATAAEAGKRVSEKRREKFVAAMAGVLWLHHLSATRVRGAVAYKLLIAMHAASAANRWAAEHVPIQGWIHGRNNG